MSIAFSFGTAIENLVMSCSEHSYDYTMPFVTGVVGFNTVMQTFHGGTNCSRKEESLDSSRSNSSDMNCKDCIILEPRWLYTLEECQLKGAEVRN